MKIISILLILIFVFSFSGCKSKRYTRILSYDIYDFTIGDNNVAVHTVEDFFKNIKNDEYLKDKTFYVLAPQYFRNEDKLRYLNFGCEYGQENYGLENYTILKEVFYVCNEEK